MYKIAKYHAMVIIRAYQLIWAQGPDGTYQVSKPFTLWLKRRFLKVFFLSNTGVVAILII